MFSQLLPSGRVSLRLPEADRTVFIKEHKTKNVEQYGVVQKEYVEMPDGMLANTQEAARYFRMSFEYASSLKPKATKRS